MKRIFLFLATNAAVLVVISVVLHVFGVNQYLTGTGIDYQQLLGLSAVVGFAGAIFSLLISKPMAKMSTGAKVIDGTEGEEQRWLVRTVRQLADRAGIGHPDVAMYEGAPNAFATGAFKNDALVAVSSGLLRSMSREEVEAVLGHEVAHIANGDMVTLTLIQGVLNTFVVFLSRAVGHFLDRAVFRSNRGNGPGYFITVMVLQVVFSIFASMIVAWFSRRREFRADAGSAELLNSPRPMINALARLGGLEPGALPESVKTSGITNRAGFMALFSTHPPIELRIAALRKQ